MASVHQGGREDINEALRLFYKAIIDPDFASGYGMGSVVLRLAQGEWLDGRPRTGESPKPRGWPGGQWI
jgi:hypothetical protein